MTDINSSSNPLPIKDRTGEHHGRWTVLGPAVDPKPNGKFYWACVCVCGTRKNVTENMIACGVSVGCGCMTPIENPSGIGRPKKHGLFGTWVYGLWQSMIRRCYSEKDICYHLYGGRGIRVCDRWKNSVEAFYADMGDRPTEAHQIDRKNSDGNYEPDNCRWATPIEQARNRKSNRFIEFNGMRKTISEWSEITGIHKGVIKCRLNSGHTPEVALSKTDLRSTANKARRKK
jgi:hypothetical protein